jgi:hypothetical protein
MSLNFIFAIFQGLSKFAFEMREIIFSYPIKDLANNTNL